MDSLEGTGAIQVALTVGGERHDVTAIHYKVVNAGSTCDDPAIAEATSTLEDEELPGDVLPPGAGSHAGSNALFVLPSGDYRVCAAPMSSTGSSQECAPTQGTVSVISSMTTEVLLVSQCGGDQSGGVDVDVALNDPPKINDLDIAPSKFITQCETAAITVDAEDPDGDALSYSWAVVNGAATLSSQGNTATFHAESAGDYNVKVTVTDVHGASTALTFPVHVSAAVCAPPCQVFGTDPLGYEGCYHTEDVPSCDDISLTGSLACSGDDCATTVPLPFVFDFYGTPRTEVNIISNGKLGFPGSSSYNNSCSLEPDTIAPFWDDLFPPAGGGVRYETLGSAPSRRFVVQWNVPHIGGSALYDIRAVLFEGSNDIRFCYANTSVGNTFDSGASATAGIAGPASSLLFSCNSPQLTDGLALEFTRTGSGGGATCTDGIQNQGETGVDCGGPCPACPETCSDGIQNQGETGVDCGGPCPACPETCSDGIQNQGETGVDCGGPCPACPGTCSDGIQNQGETGVDCGGPCPACGGGGAPLFTFIDTPADDVSSTALYDFFTGLGPVSSSQYILFEVNPYGGSGGSWCSDHADFYVNSYLSFAGDFGSMTSGSWDKYWRSSFGAWNGPDTQMYTDYFGTYCDGLLYSWCSEWGLGGLYLGVMPNQTSESYASGFSDGQGWTVRIAVGADRLSTCGF